MAWLQDGDKQNVILPILTKNNQINNKNLGNKGSLANGQCTWQEFLDRLTLTDPAGDKTAAKKGIPTEIDPNDLDALGTALINAKNGYGEEVRVGIATNTGAGVPGSSAKYNEVRGAPREHRHLICRARATEPDKVAGLLPGMKTLVTKIIKSRATDFHQVWWLGKDIETKFGLPSVSSTTVEDPRKPPGSGETVEIFDVQGTLANTENQAAIQQTFSLGNDTSEWRDHFIAWVDNYGADPWAGHPTYPVAATNHRDVLTLAYEAGVELYRPVCLPSV